MTRVVWTERSQRDLLEIGRYIAQDKRNAARRWVGLLRDRARQAAQFPKSGRRVPELGREDIRELIERGYRIVYRIVGREIHILTVFESHRQLRSSELKLDE